MTKTQLADALGDESSDSDPLHDVTVYQYHGVRGTVICFSPVGNGSWTSVADNDVVIHKDQPVLMKFGEGWNQLNSFLFHLNGASSTEITSDKSITDGYHDSSYETNGVYNIFGTYQQKTVSTSDGDFYYVSGSKMYHMAKAGKSVSFKALRSYIVSPTGSGAKRFQKTKLLALNKKYAGKIPMGGPRGGKGPGKGPKPGSNTNAKVDGQTGATQQVPSSEERTKRRQEMKANREAYNKELKAIFTDVQYQKYTENEQSREQRHQTRAQSKE